MAKPFIQALVEQEPRYSEASKRRLASSNASDGQTAIHCGEALEKVFKRVAAFEIFEKVLDDHSRAPKDGSAVRKSLGGYFAVFLVK